MNHPAVYQMLLQRLLPPNFAPDPTRHANFIGLMNRDECRTCGAAGTLFKCHGCGTARYCNTACQRGDWEKHRNLCAFDRTLKAALKETLNSGHPVNA